MSTGVALHTGLRHSGCRTGGVALGGFGTGWVAAPCYENGSGRIGFASRRACARLSATPLHGVAWRRRWCCRCRFGAHICKGGCIKRHLKHPGDSDVGAGAVVLACAEIYPL
jgi:hypothetical protein